MPSMAVEALLAWSRGNEQAKMPGVAIEGMLTCFAKPVGAHRSREGGNGEEGELHDGLE